MNPNEELKESNNTIILLVKSPCWCTTCNPLLIPTDGLGPLKYSN